MKSREVYCDWFWAKTAQQLDTIATAKQPQPRKLSEKERFVRALMAAVEGES